MINFPRSLVVLRLLGLLRIGLSVVFLLPFAGCVPALVPVSGTVTLDGQPLGSAAVMFTPPAGRPVTGKTDAQGKFSLFTNSPGDGVARGQYTVTISAYKSEFDKRDVAGKADYVERTVWLAPQKYSSPTTSGLTAAVPGNGKFDFVLESKP